MRLDLSAKNSSSSARPTRSSFKRPAWPPKSR